MSVVVGQRNVKDTPFNNKCYAVDATLDLALHTLKICGNENIFTPEYKEITYRIIDDSIGIYLNADRANRINAIKNPGEWSERDSRQRAAIAKCNELLSLINLSKRAFHLRNNKVDYWTGKVVSTRNLLEKWYDADCKRHFQ